MEFGKQLFLRSNQSNRVDYTGLIIVDVSCIGAKMYLIIFIPLIRVIGSIKGFSRCRGY